MALAVALQHRYISFCVYGKDQCFAQRRQGYGLTSQQARRALLALGVRDVLYHPRGGGGGDHTENGRPVVRDYQSPTHHFLNGDAITSTKHVVHTIDGTVVGEWGLRQWGMGTSTRKQQQFYCQTIPTITKSTCAPTNTSTCSWEALQYA